MQDLISFVQSLGRPRVALLGDFMLDTYVYGDCERISPEAPVPVLRVVRQENRVGGAASVAADVLALGGAVDCLGVLGQDRWADELLGMLHAVGGQTASLMKLPDRPTTSKTRYVGLAQHRHPQQILRVDGESRDPLPPGVLQSLRAAVRASLAQADVLAIEDYDKGVVTDETAPAIIADARAAGLAVLVDPARIGDYSRYRGCTLLTPNRHEASLASGVAITDPASLERAAERILADAGAEGVVITLDKEGAYLKAAGQPGRRITTQPRDVYDVTGAGDMVLATLCVALAGGADWEAAVALANVAGGLEVERFGVVPVRRDELLAELYRLQHQGTGKVLGRAELVAEIDRLRQAGKAVAFTNGCFDILHAGHVQTLNYARRQGDALVVAINSDASVRRIKGDSRPIVNEQERAEVLAGLACVDYVTIFDEPTPIPLLEQLRPAVLVKGGQYDYAGGVVGREVVEAYGGRIVLAPMREGRSTTNVIEKIAEVYGKRG